MSLSLSSPAYPTKIARLSVFPLLPTHVPYVLTHSATLRWSLLACLLWSAAVTWLHYYVICTKGSGAKEANAISHTEPNEGRIALLVRWAYHVEGQGTQQVTASLVGVLSLLLAFRSNSALARWEAAAKHWTGVLGSSRSMLRIVGATSAALHDGAEVTDVSDNESESEIASSGSKQLFGAQDAETDAASLLRLVACFSLALFHQLQGRRLELRGVWHLDESGTVVFEDDRELKAAQHLLPTDYEAPWTMLALLPVGFASKRLKISSDRSGGRKRSSPSNTLSSDATPVSQETEAKREALLGQNIEGAEALAEKARPQSARSLNQLPWQREGGSAGQTVIVQSDNLAGEILMEMQRLLSRLNEGLPDSSADCERQKRKAATTDIASDGEGEQNNRDAERRISQRLHLPLDEVPTRARAADASCHRNPRGMRSSRLGDVDRKPKLATPLFAHCVGLLNTLSSQQAELEQLRDLPMPAILSSHLHLLLNLHIVLQPLLITPIFLPLHSTVPGKDDPAIAEPSGVAVILCCLLPSLCSGILLTLHAIAESIAQPFGREKVKMPMIRWVVEVIREWREVQMQA